MRSPAKTEAGRRPIRVLQIEDTEEDALLIEIELRRGGYQPTCRRVDSAPELSNALADEWDLITCDWVMPGFGAPEALAILAEAELDVPIVIVSGEVGEEFAVTAMKAGAHDFVSKHRLARLVPAVDRELRDAEDRRARRRAEAALLASEHRFRAILENQWDQVSVVDPTGVYLYVSPSHVLSYGYRPGELLGKRSFDFIHPDDLPGLLEKVAEGLQQGSRSGVSRYRFQHKDGSWRWVEAIAQNLLDDPVVHGILVNARDITPRRQAEESLEAERRFLRTLVHTVPDMVWMKDPDGVYLICNPAFEQFIGRPEAEIVGRTDYEFFADREVAEFFRGKDRKAAAKGAPSVNEEWVTLAVDGRRLLLETIKTPVHDPNGEFLGVLGVAHDITATRQAENELRERLALQEQLERITAIAPGVMFSLRMSADGRCSIPFILPGIRELTGLAPESVCRDSELLFAAIDPIDAARVDSALAESMRSLSQYCEEFRFRHPQRGEVWVEARAIPQPEADGSVLWYGVVIEVTERRRANEEAHRWQQVFESAEFGLAYADCVTNAFVQVNPAFAQQRGYQPEELVGRPVLDVYAPEEQETVRRLIPMIDATGHLVFESVHLRKDGSRFPVLMEATVVRDAAGCPVSRVAYALDITARKRAEAEVHRLNLELEARVRQRTAELEEANRELEAFTYSVSHDLRAPLRAIEGFSAILRNDLGPSLSEKGARHLAAIGAGAERMKLLIDDLLKLSRLARQPLACRPVACASLVEEAWAELLPERSGRLVDLSVGDLPNCRADPGLLKQVWTNLLSNAQKYSRDRSPARIEVGSLPGADQVTYFVRDNGAGFDMEHSAKLFDVFQRLHPETEFPGTGVGLAIVQRIVRRHGGRVWAESAVDRGATFFFSLPVSSVADSSSAG